MNTSPILYSSLAFDDSYNAAAIALMVRSNSFDHGTSKLASNSPYFFTERVSTARKSRSKASIAANANCGPLPLLIGDHPLGSSLSLCFDEPLGNGRTLDLNSGSTPITLL